MEPDWGVMRPERRRRMVDLPQPLRPRSMWRVP